MRSAWIGASFYGQGKISFANTTPSETHRTPVQIHQAQIRIRVAFGAIDLDGASDSHLHRLGEHELGKGVDVEFLGVRGE